MEHGVTGRFCSTEGRAGKRTETGKRDRQRAVQLLICLTLFAVVFFAKGTVPQRMESLRQDFLTLITADTDFAAAFSSLGEALSKGDSFPGELGRFCIQVFGGEGKAIQTSAPFPDQREKVNLEVKRLSAGGGQTAAAARYLRLDELPAQWIPLEPTCPAPQQTETVVPALGVVLVPSDYSGPPLPERCSMDKISLGALQTVVPLSGTVHSGFGFREHPVDHKVRFHAGVDIGGQTGESIGAFADGIVEYIGKNESYGLYLQLDHGRGLKTFYAHCSKLCVAKGDPVSAGEKVAEVGSTGVSTGPHLHLELKYNGVRYDPQKHLKLGA